MHSETPGIGEPVTESIPAEIMEIQGGIQRRQKSFYIFFQHIRFFVVRYYRVHMNYEVDVQLVFYVFFDIVYKVVAYKRVFFRVHFHVNENVSLRRAVGMHGKVVNTQNPVVT